MTTMSGPPHFVDLHVNPGESVSIQMLDGNETILRGPATITMVSQHSFPPVPMPVQVPPGHMVQQIVDENGTLRHIILSALNNANPATNGSPAGPHQTQASPILPPNGSPATQPPSGQQAFSPYCCCSCCYCAPSGVATPGLSPGLAPAPVGAPNIHNNLLGFPTPNNLANSSSSGSSRRRTPSRSSYSSFQKRTSSGSSTAPAGIGLNPSVATSVAPALNLSSQQPHLHPPSYTNSSNQTLKSPSKSSSKSQLHTVHSGYSHVVDSVSKMIIPQSLLTSPVGPQQPVSMMMGQSPDGSHLQMHPPPELNMSGSHVSAVVSDLLSNKSSGGSLQSSGSTLQFNCKTFKPFKPQLKPGSTISASTPVFVPNMNLSGSSAKTQKLHPTQNHLQSNAHQPPATYHSNITSGLHQGLSNSHHLHHQQNHHQPNEAEIVGHKESLNDSSDKYADDFRPNGSHELKGPRKNKSLLPNGSCHPFKPNVSTPKMNGVVSPSAPSSPGDKNKVRQENESSELELHLSSLGLNKRQSDSSEVLSTDTEISTLEVSISSLGPDGNDSRMGSELGFDMGKGVTSESQDDSIQRQKPVENHILLDVPQVIHSRTRESQASISPVKVSKQKSQKHQQPTIISETTSSNPPTSGPLHNHKNHSSTLSKKEKSNEKVNQISSSHDSNESRKLKQKVEASPPSDSGSKETAITTVCISEEPKKESVGVADKTDTGLAAHKSGRKDGVSDRRHDSFISSELDGQKGESEGPNHKCPSETISQKSFPDDVKSSVSLASNGPISESKTLAGSGKSSSRSNVEEANRDRLAQNSTSGLDVSKERHLSAKRSSSSLSSLASSSRESLSEKMQLDAEDKSARDSIDGCDDQSQDDSEDIESQAEDAKRDGVDERIGGQSERTSNTKSSPSKHTLPQVQLLSLTYTALTATSVKLKWNLDANQTHPLVSNLIQKRGGNLFTHHFMVEMIHTKSSLPPLNSAADTGTSSDASRDAGSERIASRTTEDSSPTPVVRIVYQGPANNCRVSHLNHSQQYSFRVRTSLENEHLLVSNLLTITTPEQSKHKHKHSKHHSTLQEQVKEQQKMIEKQLLFHSQHSHHSSEGTQGSGRSRPEPDPVDSAEKSDQQRAIFILVLFTGVALVIAVLIQQFLTSD